MAYGKLKADTLVYDNSGSDVEVTLSSLGNKANSASPTFTGTVTIPTASANDNTTKAASTAYVQTELGDYLTTALGATKASPTFTGTVTVPTPTAGDNTTKAASTAFVVAGFAPKAAPAFTGTATGVNLTLSGDLQVNGTTTTVASTTMTVADKNIEIAKGAANDAAADGAGITIDSGDGDKTWNWVDATDAWTSSEHIVTAAGKRILVGTTTEGNTQAADLTLATTGHGGLTIRTGASNQGNIYFSDAESGSGEYEGIVAYDHQNNKFVFHTGGTLALTLDSSQNATFAGTVTDTKGDLRTIPQLSKSSAHTIVAADSGKHSINSSGGWVINTSTGFTAGQAITLINNSSGDQTITSTGVTLYNSADGSTPTKIATRGMATVICTASNVYYISGAGLS